MPLFLRVTEWITYPQPLQLKKQRIRQAVEVTIRKKKNKSAPVRIAPITLVAANSIARNTMERSIVPIIPAIRAVTVQHKSLQLSLTERAETAKATARYTTAMPRSTHKNAGVREIAPVILRKDATIPAIRLVTTAITTQPGLQLLHDVDINFTSQTILCMTGQQV